MEVWKEEYRVKIEYSSSLPGPQGLIYKTIGMVEWQHYTTTYSACGKWNFCVGVLQWWLTCGAEGPIPNKPINAMNLLISSWGIQVGYSNYYRRPAVDISHVIVEKATSDVLPLAIKSVYQSHCRESRCMYISGDSGSMYIGGESGRISLGREYMLVHIKIFIIL